MNGGDAKQWASRLLLSVVVLWCFAGMAAAGVPGFMRARMGVLSGSIQLPQGKIPPDGVIVSFFNRQKGPPPTSIGMRRVPEMVVRSDANGVFNATLLPGDYYIGVLLRARGVGPGPPKAGEKFYFAMQQDTASLATFSVATKKTTDAGRINVRHPRNMNTLDDFVTVEGVVRNDDGTPAAGALVLIKDRPNVARPLFIAAPADGAGRYRINLPPDKTYYLVARRNIQGGRPLPGNYVGTYGKTAPSQGTGSENIGAPAGVTGQGGEGEALPVSGKAGDVVQGIDITLFQIPDPEANRKKYQKIKPQRPVQDQ